MAENTEQEQKLFELLKTDALKEAEPVFEKMSRLPVIGKVFSALIALGKSGSIAAFRKSGHYRHIMNYDFKVDFDKESLQINPSDIQKEKIKKVAAVIGIVMAVLLICRLCCRCKK